MKWAQSEIGTALLCETHILGYHIHNIVPGAHFFYYLI